MSFNLLNEPWIQCETTSRTLTQVSIRDVFRDSSGLARIRGDSPAQNYAVLRLLLAIFWRAHQTDTIVPAGDTFNFTAWFKGTWYSIEESHSDQQVLDYLDQYEDRFDLLHRATPFMQVAGLETTGDKIEPAGYMDPETTPSPFAMSSGRGLEEKSLPEAARWLVFLQAFDRPGTKSAAKGKYSANRLQTSRGWSGLTGATVIHGATILQTLILNTTRACLGNPYDLAVWERPQDTSAPRKLVKFPDGSFVSEFPQGPADLATWQCRRIRLVIENDKACGIIICNGDKIENRGENQLDDPMTPYEVRKKESKKSPASFGPATYDVKKRIWHSLDALVIGSQDSELASIDRNLKWNKNLHKKPESITSLANLSSDGLEFIPELLNVELISLDYGDKGSNYRSSFEAGITLPLALTKEDAGESRYILRRMAHNSYQAAHAVKNFAEELLLCNGGDGAKASEEVINGMLAQLEPRFMQWVESLAEATESGNNELSVLEKYVFQWESQVRSVALECAWDLLLGAGQRALVGRIIPERNKTPSRQISAGTASKNLLDNLDKLLPSTKPKKKEDTAESEEHYGP